jgi:hypothetical protein
VPTAGASTLTVAVRVTDCVSFAGFGNAVNVEVVPPWLIVSMSALDVLGATFVSPA